MSLSPLIIGQEGGVPWDVAWDSWVAWPPIAGAAAPRVKPPASAAPFLSSALRFSGFEPMSLSFADAAHEENSCGESIRLSPRPSWAALCFSCPRFARAVGFPAHGSPAVKVLFAALHNGYYRNLDSVVEELARRGHEIHLGAERDDSSFGGQPIVDRLTTAYPNVTCGRTAVRDPDSLFLPAKIRFAIDYLRYLEPSYASSSGLPQRARERTPTGIVRLSSSSPLAWRPIRRLV